jgi:hypothetical protein
MKGKNGLFVRKWLEAAALVKGIFFFPEEAFTPFGAMVKTCLCILQKRRGGVLPSEGESTFLCDVENLGYEATGKPKTGSEADAAVDFFLSKAAWA